MCPPCLTTCKERRLCQGLVVSGLPDLNRRVQHSPGVRKFTLKRFQNLYRTQSNLGRMFGGRCDVGAHQHKRLRSVQNVEIAAHDVIIHYCRNLPPFKCYISKPKLTHYNQDSSNSSSLTRLLRRTGLPAENVMFCCLSRRPTAGAEPCAPSVALLPTAASLV
jgi:hypothetical protein